MTRRHCFCLVHSYGLYRFSTIALETSGSMNSSTVSFFSDLGRRISTVSDDIRESLCLFQRIPITIQRFNSALS